jgi:DNA-binding response OmpR family regulator
MEGIEVRDLTDTILVIDDEVKILEVVEAFLRSKGFNVLTATDGLKGLELFKSNQVVLVLLDLMLPGLSGEDVCMEIRKQSRTPIIMLTAKVTEDDLVKGLDTGADDYITKPFSLKELNARIEAVLRRTRDDSLPLINRLNFDNGNLIIDFESHSIRRQDQAVQLTANEYKIFSTLVKYPNKVFTREELIQIALGDDFMGFDRTIDSHIKNLRQKIELDPKNPIYVVTVHGVGYKFGGQ